MRDIQDLLASGVIPFDAMAGSTLLVTGATGLIGSLCAKSVLAHNRIVRAPERVKVVAVVRNTDKACAVFEGYSEADGLVVAQRDLADTNAIDIPFDYAIHAGSPTASEFFVSHPVETVQTGIGGTVSVLNAARRCGARSVVFLSSMEVYGQGLDAPGTARLLDETSVGDVNPLSVRSCYSEAKRMAENLCVDFAAEYDVNVKILRLAQTFGPGVTWSDRRVFALFAKSVIEQQDIVLKTTGKSTRMYLYTIDAVTAVFTALLKGKMGECYNAANPATYSSVVDMANMVAGLDPSGAVHVSFDLQEGLPYMPEHHLALDVSKLEGLGWRPTMDLPAMFTELIRALREERPA